MNEESRPQQFRLVRFLYVAVPGLVLASLFWLVARTSEPADLIGTPVPEFSLAGLDEDDSVTNEDLAGSVVVVNFWASWCGPCREEAGVLEAVWVKHRESGLIVLGVNVQDASEDAVAFVEEHGLTFPIVRDVRLRLYTELGVRGIPETFFVDREGNFAGVGSGSQIGARGSIKVLGAVDRALVESQVNRLLKLNASN